MRLLKQSTARTILIFMTDAGDRVTGKTGLTLTITASKNGAAFAAISPAQAELGNGWYSLGLTTAHTDTLGDLAIHVTGSGADPTDLIAQVVADLPGASVASVTGAVGSVTGNVGGNVNGNVAGSVASVTGNVGGNLVGTIGGLSTQAKADVNAEADAALADVGLTTTITGRIDATISSRLASASITLSGGAVTVGTNNDKTGYALSAPGVAAVADGVWDEDTAGHTTAGTFGAQAKTVIDTIVSHTAQIGVAGAGLSAIPWNPTWDAEVQSEALDALNEYDPPTNAEMVARTLPTASYANATDQTAILTDTNELQTDWTNGGRLDNILDGITGKTTNLPAAPAAVSDIPTANQNADALLDRANAIETGWTVRGILRVISAALLGKSTGADTGDFVFRNVTDTKDRVTAETDANGRTSVTLDGT